MTESPEINGTTMKHFILTVTLAFGSFSAIAAGSLDDVDEELQSADRLIYKKQYVEAILILEDAIKNEPENADAWNLLGFASRKMGKLEESAEAYSNALRIDPDHKDALEYQGELFLMLLHHNCTDKNPLHDRQQSRW